MDKKLVIFDFDGVLANTSDIAYRLHAESNPTFSLEYFKALSEGNFLQNLERAIKEDGYVVQENWYELYEKGLMGLSTHDVIHNLVIDLAKRYTLCICSSMAENYIHRFLEKENLIGCFSEVAGSDTGWEKKTKIQKILKDNFCLPKDTIFITDTVGDVEEGLAANVTSIGVTWGHHTREQFAWTSTFDVVDTVPELEATIERFFSVQ